MDEQPNDSDANPREQAAQRDYTPDYARPSRRRPAEGRAGAFNTLAWLIDGATGVVEELRHSDLGLSEEFWVHYYAMRREGLLAARAVIDNLLAQTEQESRKSQEQQERKQRRGGVPID